jgi:hypothetical protein
MWSPARSGSAATESEEGLSPRDRSRAKVLERIAKVDTESPSMWEEVFAEVKKPISTEELKATCKALAKEIHPDHAAPSLRELAEKAFKVLQKAKTHAIVNGIQICNGEERASCFRRCLGCVLPKVFFPFWVWAAILLSS